MKISLSNIKDFFFKSTPVKAQNKLQTQREELCLELLSDESSNTPDGDVVFVHGLGGDPYATWSTSSEETHWGRWLAASRPDLRVWTLGFPASPSAWLGTAMPLQDRAVNVLALMKSDGIGKRPTIFIAHSMGGLVVKQMLREALFSGTGEYKIIGQSVRGVLFLSTPHTGSDVATLVTYLGFFLRTTVAIEELEAHGAQLRDLNRWYRNHVEELGIKTLVFFENQRTFTFTVVNASSSDPGVPKVTPVGIDADHIQICKPASQKSLVYKAARDFLDEIFPPRTNGEGVKRQLSSTSEWEEKKRVQWMLVLSGTVEDIDKERAEAIVQHLRQISGDMQLTIRKVESGSVKLTIESSEEGFQRIKTLLARGQLHDVLSFGILGIELDQGARAISETSEGKTFDTAKDQQSIEIFFSYSHKDEDLRDELDAHLSVLRRNGVIAGWHDRRISAGSEWKDRIDEHLESAGVILLLVSSDFLASDYCYDLEMRRAMERHTEGMARVIPIILRNCDWSGAPFGKLQALPKNARPVKSWDDQDEAFTDIVTGIRRAIAEIVP
jgi:pimeloyl-ACP methyl ester carboxylesterase